MFTHSGYPTSWKRTDRNSLYALFDPRHDCFVYVNHNLPVVQAVQAVMSSKAPLWIYELWIPQNTPAQTITNANCEHWSLATGATRPEITFFQLHFEDINVIDCQEINLLGQISGIELKSSVAEESVSLREYAVMVGWFCQHLRANEMIADELISRVAIVDQVYKKTDIFNADVYLFISEVYKILMISLTPEEVKEKIISLTSKIDSVVLINKFYKTKLHFLKALVSQWQQSS
jgi:hypothetical protein